MRDKKIEDFISVNLNDLINNQIYFEWSISLIENIPIEKIKNIVIRNFDRNNYIFNNFSIKDYLRSFDRHFLYSDLKIFDNASCILNLLLDKDHFFYISDSQISELSIYLDENTTQRMFDRYIYLAQQYNDLYDNIENFDLFWSIEEIGDAGINYHISYLNENFEKCLMKVFANSTIDILRSKSKTKEFMIKTLDEFEKFKNGINKFHFCEYTIESELKFGKYKGKKFSEITVKNPAYIKWLIFNKEDFFIDLQLLEKLNEINPNFQIDDRILLKLFVNSKYREYLDEMAYRADEAKADSIEFNKHMKWISENPEI